MTRNQKFVLITICVFTLLGNADFTAVNLAITPISHHFHASLSLVQWILSGYSLACAIITIPAGRFADIFTAKKVFLVGAWLFTITSLLGGLAPSIYFLIVCRVFQGLALGLIFPSIYSIIANAYEVEKQGFVFGVFSAMIGFGLAIGPSLGGFIINVVGWRYVLFLNVPICLLGILLLQTSYKSKQEVNSNTGIDYIGIGLLTFVLFSSLFALNHVLVWGFISSKFLMLFGFALVVFVGFILGQSKVENPIIPLHLFKNSNYIKILILFAIAQYLFACVLYVMGIYLESARQFSPAFAGMVMLAMTLAYAIGPISGKLLNYIKANYLLAVGFLFMLIGAVLLANLSFSSAIFAISLSLILVGLGIGICLTIFNTVMMQSVPKEDSGAASGVYLTIGIYTLAMGLVVATLQLVFSSWKNFEKLIAGKHLTLAMAQSKHIFVGLQHAHYTLPKINALNLSNISNINNSLHAAFMMAMNNLMWSSAILLLIGTLIALTIKNTNQSN